MINTTASYTWLSADGLSKADRRVVLPLVLRMCVCVGVCVCVCVCSRGENLVATVWVRT